MKIKCLLSAFKRRRQSPNDRSKALNAAERRGASALEFAIVTPLIFFVVGVTMQFSGIAMSQT